MSYKVLEQNGVTNENVDGAGFNYFAAGKRDGILGGILNECAVYSPASNIVSIKTGVISVQGFRVKITSDISWAASGKADEYSIVFEIVLNPDRSVSSQFIAQPSSLTLIKDDLLASEKGTHQIEVIRFNWDGDAVSNISRRLPVIIAGSGSGGGSIELDQSLLGNEVAKVIEKLCAPEKTNERLSRLEAAAEGILFSYPIEDSACEVLRAPAHVMSYGALCRLGGAPIPQKNLLPEKILSTYRGENLTVTWDSAEGCLIFNGTVTAAEAPVVLAPFNSPATYGYYHAAIFPHSGSKIKPTGSGQVHLRFYAEDEKYISLDLSKDIPVTTGSLLRTGGKKFSRIVITTNTTMQFDNYKINILLQAGTCDEPVYVPFESLITPSPIPSKITACSPNEWEGEFSKEGLGGVTFLPQKTYSDGQYAISFFATVEGAATTCHFHTYLENGRIIKREVPTDERAQVLLEFDAPVTMFKIFPMATEEESAPYAIRVKDFQVERESPIYEFAYDFSTPYSHTLSLPESFSRYADRFIGMGNEICNHFDFERGMFVTTVKCYRMDDTLSFSADTEIASRFHAVATLPEDLIASTNYMSSSLFHPLIDETACDECIWFTEDGITIQSSLFKTAEDIPAFLRIHPIDILYEVPAEKEFLTPEEADFFSPPLLPVVPDANITLYDSSNTPVVGFIRMQYETQNLLEEEIV